MTTTPTTMLTCEALDAGYGDTVVVCGLDFSLSPGEVVAVLGPNGSGKTTLLLTLAGLLPKKGGTLALYGRERHHYTPTEASREGLVLVPDDRCLFTSLTVKQNLQLVRRHTISVDDALDTFPELRKRINIKAGQLSGGEQQMLAIARAIMLDPKVLLVDEMSMGLSPILVQRLLPIMRDIAKDRNSAVVLVEQHVNLALGVSDRALVLVRGAVALAGSSTELLANPNRVTRAYLGE